jgi:hypothetical protein
MFNLFLGCDSNDIGVLITEITLTPALRGLVYLSERLLFNANAAIVQLYHGRNKLIFNEIMMISVIKTPISLLSQPRNKLNMQCKKMLKMKIR